MMRHEEARACRIVLAVLALAVAAIFLRASPETPGSEPTASRVVESARRLVCGAPNRDVPAKHDPCLPAHSNPELTSEVEFELENETDTAWTDFNWDRANNGAAASALSRVDRADNHRFFVDAADLSRFCKLTL